MSDSDSCEDRQLEELKELLDSDTGIRSWTTE